MHQRQPSPDETDTETLADEDANDTSQQVLDTYMPSKQ